jgi:hypothetical protein
MPHAAAVCACAFVFVLGISAYWDRTIVLLHVLEAVPFAVAAALCVARRTFGYALGAASGAFWLWVAGTQTSFVRNGFERAAMLARTGSVDRWDVLIAAPAALATGGLVVCSLWSYARGRKAPIRDLALFVSTAVLVVAYFAAIFAAAGPRFLPLVRRAFGL